ncbi:CD109 antigen-like [Mya arenaria]|uniref:CD109 antigen-like n=1 Tax=Mya arenaria TaxID=6604 RepID=UPI0022DEF987|nr:CD109 antigen-like [Mya arenaria]
MVEYKDGSIHQVPAVTLVNSGQGHSTYVKVLPSQIGDLDVSVMAKIGDFFQTIAYDKVQRTIQVKPNGVYKTMNEQHLVHVQQSSFSNTFRLTDPPNIVRGSKKSSMTISGDFMVPSIDGLSSLLQQPYGCGEQNMMNFAPDVYITKYLKVVGKLTSDIQRKAKGQMEFGYQNEMTKVHYDGSFSAFGNSDSSGSTWLTAFVLKCFGQAKDLITIDDNVMGKAMMWLLTHQMADGSFSEPERIIHTNMQSGSGHGVPMTAFTLVSLLENQQLHLIQGRTVDQAIKKSVQYLETRLNTLHDAYSTAVTCYALAKANSSLANTCFTKLQNAASHEGEKMYWKKTSHISKRVGNNQLSARAPPQDVETTSYALLTYIQMGKVTEAFSIVKWLISQRNPTGGFVSTQDTMVSLQALSEFSSRFALGPSTTPGYGVHFHATGSNFAHIYDVSSQTYDVSHKVEIPTSVPQIDVQVSGLGVAVLDVTSEYYVQGSQTDNHINVTVGITHETLNSITVKSCMRWTDPSDSGMLLMEVELPTGFNPDVDTLKAQAAIKQFEQRGRYVPLYFDGLRSQEQVCVNVKINRADPVVRSQPCHVIAYDYYEPTRQSVAVYESGVLKSSNICDVCPACSFCTSGNRPPIVG